MKYIFGKDIVRNFYPLENNQPINLPTQTPHIYLFDTYPSLAAAAAGTSALQSLTTWSSQEADPYARTYTFTAINDPSPTSATNYKQYWEAINYVPKTGVTIAPLIRSIWLYRAEANETVPGTTAQDLKDIYPGITAYLTDAQLQDMLSIALEEMKLDFEASGLEWARIYDLYKTKLALAFKTIALANLSQIRESNDKFQIRYKEFEDKYARAVTSLKLPYDYQGDGDAGAPREVKRSYYITAR